MHGFEIGDEVVCIDAAYRPIFSPFWPATSPVQGLTEGSVYTIAGFGFWPGDEVTPVVFLAETQNCEPGGEDCGYDPSRFRKVQRRDWSVWLAAKNTIENPNPVRTPAKEPA